MVGEVGDHLLVTVVGLVGHVELSGDQLVALALHVRHLLQQLQRPAGGHGAMVRETHFRGKGGKAATSSAICHTPGVGSPTVDSREDE